MTIVLHKLTKTEGVILGALLAVLEGVQINISMSLQAHATITMFVMVMAGAGIQAISATTFLSDLPAHVAAFISSALGGFLVLISTWHITTFWQTVIAVVLTAAMVLGVGPAAPPLASGHKT